MTNPRRPRFVYVLSDGGWSDTRAGVRADPAARRARRPDDPPLDRDRAAVGRVRPHHRDHRPRAGARPHRRRHRRRAPRPPALTAARHQPLSHERTTHVHNQRSPSTQSPVLFDVSTVAGGELPAARIERVALEHIELAANPRREIADEGIDRLAKMLCSSGQLVPCIGRRPDPDAAEGDPVRRPAPLPRRPGQPRPRRQRVHGRPRRARPQPDRAAARPRPDAGGDPPHPGPLPAARGAHALRPAAAVRRLLAGPRRTARRRPDRRRLRRPRHLARSGRTTSAASSPSPSRSAPASPSARAASRSR